VSDDPSRRPPVGSPHLALSEHGSAHAPILYFEDAPTFGYLHGVVRITVEVGRLYSLSPGDVTADRIVVAHLRMTIQAARALKSAIDGALLLANPPSSDAKN